MASGVGLLQLGLVIAPQIDYVRQPQPQQLVHVGRRECLEIIRPQQPAGNDFAAVGGWDTTDVAQVGQAVEVDPHPFHI